MAAEILTVGLSGEPSSHLGFVTLAAPFCLSFPASKKLLRSKNMPACAEGRQREGPKGTNLLKGIRLLAQRQISNKIHTPLGSLSSPGCLYVNQFAFEQKS